MSDANVVEAAVSWHMARTDFLKLPANDPKTREFLSALADAEGRLSKAVRDGVGASFGKSRYCVHATLRELCAFCTPPTP